MQDQKIVIVDYGVGNCHSVKNMFKKAGFNAIISANHDDIIQADKILLPGVGHFDYAMHHIKQHNLVAVLQRAVFDNHVPIMGICVGAQLLGHSSTEGSQSGLGFIHMRCQRFFENPKHHNINYRVPHMGWNNVLIKNKQPILTNIDEENRFYFAHSYHFCDIDSQYILASCDYGYEFPVVVQHHHIIACQFHPEKSLQYGLRIIENFGKWTI